MRTKVTAFVFALLASASICARDYTVGPLRLQHPTSEATSSGQTAVGVYLAISNSANSADRLISASSNIASAAMLHAMESNRDGMHSEGGFDVPAKGSIVLESGGPHIMLSGLTQALKAGDRFPLKLVFQHAGTVLVEVDVAALRH